MTKFENAKNKIAEIVSKSEANTDLGHSLNTLEWLLKLRPDADEILQLAALSHDIERGTPDPVHSSKFESYNAYKVAHAVRGAKMAEQIAKDVGYSDEEAKRLAYLVEHHETGNDDPDVNVIMDADSISFFDYNIEAYLKYVGEKQTKKKILFMKSRASENAKKFIDEIMKNKPELNKLFN